MDINHLRGKRVTWTEASDLLDMSRSSITNCMHRAIYDQHPNYTTEYHDVLLQGRGIQFEVAGYSIWMGQRSGQYKIRLRQLAEG